MRTKKPLLGLQATIAVFACIIVALALVVTYIIINDRIAQSDRLRATVESIEIARIVADNSVIVDGLSGKGDAEYIQDFAQKITDLSAVQFITVMDMNRIRKSHLNPSQIGTYYEEEDVNPAFSGIETTSENKGSLGRSLRAFSPVFGHDGQQIGVVLVGILLDRVQDTIDSNMRGIYVGVGFGMLAGILGALVLARRIKKIMFGLEPFAIAKLLEERSAMIQSVREGIIAVDRQSRVTILNEQAIKIFHRAGLDGKPVDQKVNEYVSNTKMGDILETGEAELDQEQDLNGITILSNRIPIIVDGEIVGAITTFRDRTEMRQLAEKLTDVQIYAEALRAQTHEFMNKLHVIIGMVRLGYYERLTSYVSEIANQYQVEVGYVVKKIKDPVLAGFLLGRLSLARENGAKMILSDDSYVPVPAKPELVHEVITIVGNLINNALDAIAESTDKNIIVHFSYDKEILTIKVSDTGDGIDEEIQKHIFRQGYSTKGTDRGLGLYLIKRSLERLGGEIKVVSTVGKGAMFSVTIPYYSKEEYLD